LVSSSASLVAPTDTSGDCSLGLLRGRRARLVHPILGTRVRFRFDVIA
jgi:hypothetical protein